MCGLDNVVYAFKKVVHIFEKNYLYIYATMVFLAYLAYGFDTKDINYTLCLFSFVLILILAKIEILNRVRHYVFNCVILISFLFASVMMTFFYGEKFLLTLAISFAVLHFLRNRNCRILIPILGMIVEFLWAEALWVMVPLCLIVEIVDGGKRDIIRTVLFTEILMLCILLLGNLKSIHIIEFLDSSHVLIPFLFSFFLAIVDVKRMFFTQKGVSYVLYVILCTLLFGSFLFFNHHFSFIYWFVFLFLYATNIMNKGVDIIVDREVLISMERYVIIISYVMVMIVLINMPTSEIRKCYGFLHHYLSYRDYGFIQRALPGEIIRLFAGYRISVETMVIILKLIWGGLFFLCTYLVLCFIRRKTEGGMRFYLTIVYLITVFYSGLAHGGFAGFDLYLRLLLVAFVLSAFGKYCSVVIFVCSIIGMLIHPVFFLTCYPFMLLIIFLNEIECGARNVKKIIYGMIIALVLGGMFWYFSIYVPTHSKISSEQAKTIVMERTNEEYNDEYDFFFNAVIIMDKVRDHVVVGRQNITVGEMLLNSFRLLLFFPLYIWFISLVKHRKELSDFYCEDYFVILYPVVSYFLLFVFECDYGRWDQYIVLEMVLLSCVYYDKSKGKTAEKLMVEKVFSQPCVCASVRIGWDICSYVLTLFM